MIVPRHYENLNLLHENTMPNRNYYIPSSVFMGTLVENRTASDRFYLLNGDWKFKYYDSIYDVEEGFFNLEYDSEAMEKVAVPGVWQNYGYDHHQYTNIRYPFPFDPPYVPQDNPCGAYILDFEYAKDSDAPRAYLNFEGVDSCFYLWVNGVYTGYSQVTHSTSEFDVTDLLKEGKNRIAILVLKWCDGSYMEDQDKFRMSGIIRDVYLLKRPKNFIYDYFITTKIDQKQANINLKISYFDKVIDTNIKIFDQDNKEVSFCYIIEGSDDIKEKNLVLQIENPILWNAENPYLYTIIFEIKDEVITDQIGIREVKIIDNQVCINGQPIVFKGVNRHDSDPVTGSVISMEQIKTDLKMMREHNFNSIRSSHYPNAPYFYQLCDKYGFYVIDEADNESHGPVEMYYENNDFMGNVAGLWNKAIADNPDFIKATVDRVQRCVQRDKNRPCVVIWSMGNECAYGCTFEEALKWVKSVDTSRLTLYESARYHGDDRKYDFSNIDIYSRMYPSIEEIQEYLDSNPDKPYLLIEYSHAMGNGPGDLEAYFQTFHKNKLMCGGFVWEWCDHAIDHGKAEDGRTIYYYGGDHGEDVHDGNFCVDGLVYPDRRPHTGLMEYKNIYRPVRVEGYDEETGMIALHNYLDFFDISDYLNIEYELFCDGKSIKKGSLEGVSIEPHQTKKEKLILDIPEKGNVYLKLYYLAKQDSELVKTGHLLGFDEVLIKNKDGRNQIVQELLAERTSDAKLLVKETEKEAVITGDNFVYIYDKRRGMLSDMVKNGTHITDKMTEINIWRAPTDNDINIKQKWYRARYDKTYSRAYESEIIRKDNEIQIVSHLGIVSDVIQKIADIKAIWTIYNTGRIDLEMNIKKDPEFPEFPRFGIRFFLNNALKNVEYFGMGPVESYVDKHHASSHGIYKADVRDMHEDYIRPQENGSHYDCSYVVIHGENTSLTVCGDEAFSFNASIYSQEELTKKKHNYELIPEGCTVLCIDYAQNGIGSNSCGPELEKKYRFDQREFTFKITLV